MKVFYEKNINDFLNKKYNIFKKIKNSFYSLILIIIILYLNINIIINLIFYIWLSISLLNFIIEIINYNINNYQLKKWIDLYNNYKKNQANQSYDDSFYESYKKYSNYKKEKKEIFIINTDIDNAFKLFNLSINVDVETIKKRYRELAILYHPDKFIDKSEKIQKAATRNFQKLNNAYNIIKKYKNLK
jgi:hypothetical protein